MFIKATLPGQTKEKTFEVTNQTALEFFYLKKQLEAFDLFQKMVGAKTAKPAEYQDLKKQWEQKRKDIDDIGSNLFKKTLEEYKEKINPSKEAVKKKFEEIGKEVEKLENKGETLFKEADPAKLVPPIDNWKSLWALGNTVKEGRPLPSGIDRAEVEKHLKWVGKTQGKNTMAYAYWKSIMRDLESWPQTETEKQTTESKETKKRTWFWKRNK